MPTYVYRCRVCEYVFERVHRMSDQGPTSCSQCHAEDISKLITSGQFILKGDGWYHDGYGSSVPSQKEDT